MNDFDVFIMLLNNVHFYIAKKLHYINKNSLDHCKIETRACISFIYNYGLTAIDNILITRWKRATCPCDQLGDEKAKFSKALSSVRWEPLFLLHTCEEKYNYYKDVVISLMD